MNTVINVGMPQVARAVGHCTAVTAYGRTLLHGVTHYFTYSVLNQIAFMKRLTLRRLMSYIYGAPILDVSRSHTTTQHSQ